MQYVVIGAGGYIGSYLFQQMKADGCTVIGTSRKPLDIDNMFHFDLETDVFKNIVTNVSKYEKDKIAIICIAEANIDKCYEDYEQTYEINVIKTRKLIEDLSENGFRIIYFSSDNVFDGKAGGYTEDSPTCAVNKYGMMKAEMEQYLLEEMPDACILRIPKVVSTSRVKKNILEEWSGQIETGTIRCIRGNRISFVCINDIYHACRIVAEQGLCGLYNIVGDKAYSRAELARMFYDKLGVTQKVDIQELDLDQFFFKDRRPLDLSMSNHKFRIETGYHFTSMETVMEMYINNLK